MTIAIDGLSSTGKSTLAKQLAEHLDYIYVDSGAMYRAVALFAIENGCSHSKGVDSKKLISMLEGVAIEFKHNSSQVTELYLNGENVESKIRTMEVSNLVSATAAIPEVRQLLVQQQQQMGAKKGIVMDGRDIGSVVFPDAELKLFMTASNSTRAKRRYDELLHKGMEVSYDEVYQNLVSRDHMDSTREDSPLHKTDDAIEIDNSELTLNQQFELVKTLILDVKK